MPQVADLNVANGGVLASDTPVVPVRQQAGETLTHIQRRTRIGWLVVLSAVYGISFAVPRTRLPHVPLCWLHALTGWSCPTCGMTRAFTEIGHGNFAAATQFNLLAIPLFVLGLGLFALLLHEVTTRRNWLGPWVARHWVALVLLGASCVVLRYIPLAIGA